MFSDTYLTDLTANGSVGHIMTGSGYRFYFMESNTGWTCIYSRTLDSVAPPFSSYFVNIAPLLLVYIAIDVLLSTVIAKQINAPVKRLIDDCGAQDMAKEGANEYQIIREILSKSGSETDKLRNIVDSVKGDVVERLLSNLLMGVPIDTTYFNMISRSYNLNLDAYGLFDVMVCSAQADDVNRVASVIKDEMENHLAQKSQFIKSYFVLSEFDSLVCCILSYFPNTPLQAIPSFEKSLTNTITLRTASLGSSHLIRFSNLCTYVFDLQFSFMLACDKLRDMNSLEENFTDGKVLQSYHEWLIRYITKAAQYAMVGDIQNAALVNQQITEFVTDSSKNTDTAINMLKQMVAEYDRVIYYLEPKQGSSGSITDGLSEIISKYEASADKIDVEALKDKIDSELSAIVQILAYINQQSGNKYIDAAQKYMQDNYHDGTLSLQTTAEHVGVNPSYLSKLFKATVGENFIDSLNKHRVEASKDLLRDKKNSLAFIAEQSGFNSEQNFIRVFKKYQSITPGQYRQSFIR